MKTVLLTTVINSFRAYLLQDILNQEGILSFLRNETISSVYNIPGMEMEVMVFEDDYERAREIYEKGFQDYNEEDVEQE